MDKRGGSRHGGRGAERLMEQYDGDKDEKITRTEFDEVRLSQFSGADADGNQAVTLEEFVTVWQDKNSDRIVRGFQRLDVDGDLKVSREEYSARTSDFVEHHDRNGDGVVTTADENRGRRDGRRAGNCTDKQGEKAADKRPPRPAKPDKNG